MNLNNYSFFDFDNTLYKGQTHYLILDFSFYLSAKNIFNSRDAFLLQSLFNDYQKKLIDRNQFVIEVVQTYYHGLRGCKTLEIVELALKYWSDFKYTGWYPYTDPLLNLLKKYTTPILISGSPFEILKHSQKLSGFHIIYGSKGVVHSDVYSGEMECEIATEEAKEILIGKFIKNHNVDPQYSFVFGDSSSDYPLLRSVDPANAYLLGGNDEQNKYAQDNNWNYLKQDLRIIEHVEKRIHLLFP